jgi:hypothetical protein
VNLIELYGLLTAAKYHMILREKLETMKYPHELLPRKIKDHLILIDDIINLLIRYRDALRKRLN